MQTTDTAQHASPQPSAGPEKLPGIRHIIAVGSGKGGVGKSTVSVNLALALQQRGLRVGLVDADILGPSIPGMLGIPTGEPPEMTADSRMIPAQRYGLKVVSMGMLTGDDQPAVLRGPMVGKYLKMFVGGVQWGDLDYLILDLPPGTGDTQLTLAQSMPLSGVVIVTMPQAVSLKIARRRRRLRMFEKVQVPILGIVENMRSFSCPHCGETTDIFRHGGGEQMSEELGVPFLGALPIDGEVVTCGDEGRPIVVDQPKSVSARVYSAIATTRCWRSCRPPSRLSSPSSGSGTATPAHRPGWRARWSPPARATSRWACDVEMRAPCRCCGRTASTTTSTCVTCDWPALARYASRR